MPIEEYLTELTQLFQNNLQSNLVGIYLHGSLAMGCYQKESSDIDVLIVIKEKLSTEKKKALIRSILQLDEFKLEMSILLEKNLVEFKYPTPFELHYSEMHKEKYLQDEDYLCREGADPDLAAHLVVTYERGVCLYGKPIHEVFQPIDQKFYIQSILYDVENSVQEIVHNPVYYTLNLCRVLFYLKEGIVSSKKEGGEWGMKVLPDRYTELISHSLSQYTNLGATIKWNNPILTEFAEYMIIQIKMY